MEEKKTDRRVLRTRKAIRSAFAELLSEKDYNDITVTDISERADINRKTFYNYYRNTEDLVQDIENEAIADFDTLMDDLREHHILDNPEMIVTRISAAIESNLDYFRDFLIISKNAALFNRIADSLKKQIRVTLADQDVMDPMKAEALSIYITSGALSVYRDWLMDGRRAPREELDAYLQRLTIACVSEALNN